jgi:Secretion system C-terminal sorting domain
MKRLLLITALFISLPAVISSQTHNERLNTPFLRAHLQINHGQPLGIQPGEKEFQGIRQNRFLNKNKKNNEFGSVIYKPIQVTCEDTLRYTYTYDNSGNRLTELDETWINNSWVNSLRDTLTYDNSGHLLTELWERWSFNTWVNFNRNKYTYDNSGYLLTDITEAWANNSWVNGFRWTNTYDNSGNRLTELGEIWSNNAWINSWSYTYTYDNSGNQLTYLYETWSNNAWVNSFKWTDSYDNSGNWITELLEQWSNNAWINSWSYTFTYDNSGNQLTELDEVWSNNVWINNHSYAYEFDNNGNCIHSESLMWQDSVWVKDRTNFQLFYNHHQDYLYYYGAVIDLEYTSITGIASEQLTSLSFNLQQNFPNPFNPTTTINYSLAKEGHVKLIIYNAIGSQVAIIVDEYRPAGNYSIQFNGNNLASGIYLYRLESGNYSAAKKFVLMK